MAYSPDLIDKAVAQYTQPSGTMYRSMGDVPAGNTITSSLKTSFAEKYILDPAKLFQGQLISVLAWGILSSPLSIASGLTITLELNYGQGTNITLVTSNNTSLITSLTNKGWRLSCSLNIRRLTPNPIIGSQGIWHYPNVANGNGTAPTALLGTGIQAFNPAIPNEISITAQWSGLNLAGNTITMQHFEVRG